MHLHIHWHYTDTHSTAGIFKILPRCMPCKITVSHYLHHLQFTIIIILMIIVHACDVLVCSVVVVVVVFLFSDCPLNHKYHVK